MAQVKISQLLKLIAAVSNALSQKSSTSAGDGNLGVYSNYESQKLSPQALQLHCGSLQKLIEKTLHLSEGADDNLLQRVNTAMQHLAVLQGKQAAGGPTVDPEIPVDLQQSYNVLFLRGRMVANTNANYNANPYSRVNQAFIAFAINYFEILKLYMPDSGIKHYYELLIPELHVEEFVSSRGNIGDLELYEFFIGEDGIPIEVQAMLEKFRETYSLDKNAFPYHVCLPKNESTASVPRISKADLTSLCYYLPEAKAYYNAILQKKTAEELDACRKNLDEAMHRKPFVPRCAYSVETSNRNLFRNGFFNTLNITSFDKFATFLTERVDKNDWFDFVTQIVIGSNSIDSEVFFQLILPKVEEVQPPGTLLMVKADGTKVMRLSTDGTDVVLQSSITDKKMLRNAVSVNNNEDGTVLLELPNKTRALKRPDGCLVLLASDKIQLHQKLDGSKVEYRPDGSLVVFKADTSHLATETAFESFVQAHPYSADKESLYNRAIQFLDAECYKRKRNSEGVFLSEAAKMAGAVMGVDDREQKKNAAVFYQKFLISDYPIDNWMVCLGKNTQFISALTHDRLGCITRKGNKLGSGTVTRSQKLAVFAESLSGSEVSQWRVNLNNITDDIMWSIMDKSDGLDKYAWKQKYRQPRDTPAEANVDRKYNKAVLILISEFYRRTRPQESDGFFGYKGGQKNEAITAFQEWILSGEDIPLEDFLHRPYTDPKLHTVKPDRLYLAPVLRDESARTSVTRALMQLAENFCMPKYAGPKVKVGWW